VAGCADPSSGWDVSVNGQRQIIGGTSAVAPMWASLAALLQQTGKPLSHESLYANRPAFIDVISGSN
jgi:kumamolisin